MGINCTASRYAFGHWNVTPSPTEWDDTINPIPFIYGDPSPLVGLSLDAVGGGALPLGQLRVTETGNWLILATLQACGDERNISTPSGQLHIGRIEAIFEETGGVLVADQTRLQTDVPWIVGNTFPFGGNFGRSNLTFTVALEVTVADVLINFRLTQVSDALIDHGHSSLYKV